MGQVKVEIRATKNYPHQLEEIKKMLAKWEQICEARKQLYCKLFRAPRVRVLESTNIEATYDGDYVRWKMNQLSKFLPLKENYIHKPPEPPTITKRFLIRTRRKTMEKDCGLDKFWEFFKPQFRSQGLPMPTLIAPGTPNC